MPRHRVGEPQLSYGVSKTERTLKARIEQDLSFQGQKTAYASHNTHAFAAKFPPQLPKTFIEELTRPGEKVLDPMAGSGTALVEAALAGRIGIGVDIDPLAVRISRAKVTPLNPARMLELAEMITDNAELTVSQRGEAFVSEVLNSFDFNSRAFIEYWFERSTIAELGALISAIQSISVPSYRQFFEVLFSSIVVTKSGGVTLARDLAHSRPHKVSDKKIRNAIHAFADKAAKATAMLEEMAQAPGRGYVVRSDSKNLPLPTNMADLIVTSPPYANAIDYVRAHKFSLVWLGSSIPQLKELRRHYIGAEARIKGEHDIHSETAKRTVKAIRERDPKRAHVVIRYFSEMTRSLKEMHRVIRRGRPVIVVVGSSTIRGVEVPTGLILAEIGERLGFSVVGVNERQIDRDRRLMPVSHQSTGRGIEARMHREHVIAFSKR